MSHWLPIVSSPWSSLVAIFPWTTYSLPTYSIPTYVLSCSHVDSVPEMIPPIAALNLSLVPPIDTNEERGNFDCIYTKHANGSH